MCFHLGIAAAPVGDGILMDWYTLYHGKKHETPLTDNGTHTWLLAVSGWVFEHAAVGDKQWHFLFQTQLVNSCVAVAYSGTLGQQVVGTMQASTWKLIHGSMDWCMALWPILAFAKPWMPGAQGRLVGRDQVVCGVWLGNWPSEFLINHRCLGSLKQRPECLDRNWENKWGKRWLAMT